MTHSSALYRHVQLPKNRPAQTDIFIAGVGAVGGTLIRQLKNLSDTSSFNLIGVCNSSRTLWLDGKSPTINRQTLAAGELRNWDEVLKKLRPRMVKN